MKKAVVDAAVLPVYGGGDGDLATVEVLTGDGRYFLMEAVSLWHAERVARKIRWAGEIETLEFAE